MTVEIRRRTALPVAVAVLAAILAGGYVWLYVATGGRLPLILAGALALVACWYVVAWSTARLPLLVADDTGVRVRLGRQWTGVPWEDMDRVEVHERGAVTDGRVSIVPRDDAAPASPNRWSRWQTTVNRWLYGSALVVPYGLTTTVSTEDLSAALQELAAGRTEVVDVLPRTTEAAAEPEPIAETEPLPEPESSVGRGGSTVHEPQADTAAPSEPDQAPGREREPKLPAQRAGGRHMAVVGFWEEEEELSSPDAIAKPVVPVPVRPMPGGDEGSTARREDVTLALRREPVEGSLALYDSADEARTEELPEIDELRRNARSAERLATGDVGSGNIALIIDATTDLSARAMRKVRRPGSDPSTGESEPPADDAAASAGPDLHIGSELRRARENLGLSVDELADRTRIRPFVIECMEADDFSACGGDFYARGHLRMLARVLGVASEPLVAAYDEHYATSPVSLREVFDAELASGSTGMVRGGAADANWMGLAAAVVVLVVIWGVARLLVG